MYTTTDPSPIGKSAAFREASRGMAGARPAPPRATAPAPLPSAGPVDVSQVLAWLRRGLWLAVLLAVVFAGAGFAFGTLSKPRFTTSVDLIVDPGNLQVVTDDVLPRAGQTDTQLLAVESKLHVLTSGATLAAVVANLHLDQDPEFVPPAGGLFDAGATKGDPATTALRTLSERIKAGREERSYMVTLTVWTESPAKSVAIANAIVAAFRDELAKSDADAVGQAATALDDRLAGLKATVSAAEDKVEAFKRAHNLQENAGQLSSSIAVAQINTQVIDATRALNDAQAHYQQLSAGGSAANAEAGDSTTMSALRAQYSTLKQQVESLAHTLGPKHPSLLALKPQLAAAKHEIDQETARVVRAAKTEVQQAETALATLKQQQASASATVFDDNDEQVQLNQLERDATAQATIYQTFLARTRAVAEQQEINSTNVRVISPPLLPEDRSYPPRTVLLIMGGAVLGLLAGASIAVGLGLLRRLGPLRRTA